AYGSDKAAKEWFKRATDDDMKPDVFTYTSLIAACAKVSNVDSAEAWLSKMAQHKVNPLLMSYSAAINACAKNNLRKNGQRAYNLLSRMSAEGIYPNTVAYNAVLEALGKNRPVMTRESELVFRHMIESGIESDYFTQVYLRKVIGAERVRQLCAEVGVE
ncbi:unnamed protein product, partial [Polarella glacialis]